MRTSQINWQEFFGECKTTDDLKRTYKTLAFQWHPDRGGDLEMMKRINVAFDAAVREFVPSEKADKSEDYYDWRAGVEASIREAIEAIIALPGLDIEICGLWVWVTGQTREAKESLKAAGYRWSRPKVAWYFAGCPSRGKGRTSLDEIRNVYGSERVWAEREEKQSAWALA